MSDPTILLNISEMIDLAIGTPEVGVVDFCMLQTVLHCLAQQMRVLGKHVELRGTMATLPYGKMQDTNAATVAVSEFTYDTSGSPPGETGEMVLAESPPPQDQETILVVERVKKSPPTSSPMSPPTKTARSARASSATGVHGITSSEKLSLVTYSKFNVLENVVDDLKNRVYGSMPKNEAILEEVRSQTNLKAITDMWTSLNVSSRLEAAEEGIAKLSSLVQDLIGETAAFQDIEKRHSQSTVPGDDDTAASATASVTRGTTVESLKRDFGVLNNTFNQAVEDIGQMKNDILQLFGTIGGTPGGGPGHLGGGPGQPGGWSEQPGGGPGQPGGGPGQPGGGQYYWTELNAADESAPPGTLPGAPPENLSPEATTDRNIIHALTRLTELEKKMNKCCDTINKVEGVMQDQLTSFQDQLQALEIEFETGRAGGKGQITPEMVKDIKALMELFHTVQDMQSELKQVHDSALHLAADKDERQANLQSLLEQIELLKVMKLDREDMEEALADKADVRMLGRKVSHDQFELACDDLSRSLEHAVGKLHVQEALWQQALDDIQREIEMKLDKMELGPVKDFFNTKLKQLQENIKQLASLRREVEAAGTKKKLFSNVNCLSCDAQAVMTAEAPTAIPVSKPLPAHMSMKPYLCYELDSIRKNQMSSVPQRNMHDWETMGKQAIRPKLPVKVRSETDKHLCNRYCGGSHTVTTAAQRVARTGHFVKQWGPEVLPLSTTMATGDDGRLYKVTTDEPQAQKGPGGAVETAARPQTPSKKVQSEQPQHPCKPVVISAECRCLDYDPVKMVPNKPKSAK